MAKYYFRLILLFGAVIGFFALIGSLLPRSYSFTTEIEISATPEEIFPELNSLRNWTHWSRQWNPEKIESLVISYNGEPAGKGAAQSWTDIRGSGKLWITESLPPRSITYEMTFEGFPKMVSEFELAPTESVTRVLWSSEGRLPGGPFYGYFGWFFSAQMKSEYQMSLESLKSYVENQDPSNGTELPDDVEPTDTQPSTDQSATENRDNTVREING